MGAVNQLIIFIAGIYFLPLIILRYWRMTMRKTEEENLNPPLPETRFGVLRVPEMNAEKQKRLVPILKFDDWGNEIEKSDEHGN